MDGVKIGKYRHFKGIIMEVICVARHSESLEELVIYKHISHPEGQDEAWWQKYGENSIWARPKSMFLEKVKRDGKEFQRFEYIGP